MQGTSTRSSARTVAVSAGYGLGIFAGTALLGFVIAPWLGIASGLFAIEAEGRAFFSMLTLRGVPFLLILAAASGLAYPALSARPLPLRLLVYAANVLVAWLVAAGIALVILG